MDLTTSVGFDFNKDSEDKTANDPKKFEKKSKQIANAEFRVDEVI